MDKEFIKEFSGETRKEWKELLYQMLEPLIPLFTREKSGIKTGVTLAHYEEEAAYMEAFSRPLWALVPLWRGNRAGGEKDAAAERFAEIYREGLKNGTDPESPGYWGRCHSFDQRFVEMAAIAYGIMYAEDVIWTPLEEKTKENLSRYLNQINDYELPVCNWMMFAVMVNIAMKKTGMPYRADMLEKYLNAMEEFYLGNGWYQDGDSGQKDYYVSFAIHFYNMIYADVMKDIDPERSRIYKERACTFGKQFVYWFDRDGAAIPFGRSLTYRFAQVSFFSACLLTGVAPFSKAVMKGMIVRHMKDWLQYPIFDRDGVLTIGYAYPNLCMSERYNAFGSPYWSMKTFAFMALAADDELWKTAAESYPVPEGSGIKLEEADMYIKNYGTHTTAYAPGVYSPYGHGGISAKYGKFAYDTRFSISVPKSAFELHENAPDSMLAFVLDGYVYVRRICLEHKINDDGVWSKWSPVEGITVETTIKATEKGHERIHLISTERSCKVYDCGFSVSRDHERFITECEAALAKAENTFQSCIVSEIAESGFAGKGKGMIIYADPNTNLLFPKSIIPATEYEICTEKGKKAECRLHTAVFAAIGNERTKI